jgi:hypothetical protein
MLTKVLTKKAKKAATVVIAFTSVVAIGVLAAAPAGAQGNQFQQVIDVVESQSMLTEKMSKELMLVALEVEPEANRDNLQLTRSMFDRRLTALRHGDIELALPGTQDPTFLKDLDRVEELWPSMDSAIVQSLDAEKVPAESVQAIDKLGRALLLAVDKTASDYQDLSKASRSVFSIQEISLAKAARQRMLTQKMTKEYLMIAYGHDVKTNSTALVQTVREFDRILEGLISGDPELLITPAPTSQLQEQLKEVKRLWKEFKGLILTAANGVKPTPDAISEVASKNLALLEVTDATVVLYKAI